MPWKWNDAQDDIDDPWSRLVDNDCVCVCVSSMPEHWLLQRDEISTFHREERAWIMADHYRYAWIWLWILPEHELPVLVARDLHVEPFLLVPAMTPRHSGQSWGVCVCQWRALPDRQRVLVGTTLATAHQEAALRVFRQQLLGTGTRQMWVEPSMVRGVINGCL